MALRVLSATYAKDEDFYRYLGLNINGEEARVYLEGLKKPLVDAGYIFLGSKWARKLDPIELPEGKAENEHDMTLEGFTDDPVIVRLVREYVARVNDEPEYFGPVDVPEEG